MKGCNARNERIEDIELIVHPRGCSWVPERLPGSDFNACVRVGKMGNTPHNPRDLTEAFLSQAQSTPSIAAD